MRIEPPVKRAIVFFDGQNLFHHSKETFGYNHPNYDPHKLAHHICGIKGWVVDAVNFYTGLHTATENEYWNKYWTSKMAIMGTRGIKTIHRPLRYHDKAIICTDGSTKIAKVGQEKGIDVRIALDIVQGAVENLYDVALLFSQDHDLFEAVQDVRKISELQDRWIKIACAFPVNGLGNGPKGIRNTEWIPIDKTTYDLCLDLNSYNLP